MSRLSGLDGLAGGHAWLAAVVCALGTIVVVISVVGGTIRILDWFGGGRALELRFLVSVVTFVVAWSLLLDAGLVALAPIRLFVAGCSGVLLAVLWGCAFALCLVHLQTVRTAVGERRA